LNRSGLISGTVVDEAGRAVGGARVYFASGPGTFPDMAGLTGEDGSFALAAPNAGTYAVQVHADGFAQATASVRLKAGEKRRIEVVLRRPVESKRKRR
jgi:carboxypeptidase family protein